MTRWICWSEKVNWNLDCLDEALLPPDPPPSLLPAPQLTAGGLADRPLHLHHLPTADSSHLSPHHHVVSSLLLLCTNWWYILFWCGTTCGATTGLVCESSSRELLWWPSTRMLIGMVQAVDLKQGTQVWCDLLWFNQQQCVEPAPEQWAGSCRSRNGAQVMARWSSPLVPTI